MEILNWLTSELKWPEIRNSMAPSKRIDAQYSLGIQTRNASRYKAKSEILSNLIYSSLLHPFGSFRPGFRNLKTKLTSRTTWWNHVVNIFVVVKPVPKCYLSQRKNTWNPPNVFSIILPSSHFLENINWFQEGFGILPKIRLLCLHQKLHFKLKIKRFPCH